MALLKNGEFVADPWAKAAALDEVPANGPVLVSLELWQHQRGVLLRRAAPLGLQLASDQPPELVLDVLENFSLIALEFPKFTDGRAYSYARNLRERYGYEGEVRAVGNVLRDQLPLLRRCGFDAFELPDRAQGEGWITAFSDISVVMQPAADTAV